MSIARPWRFGALALLLGVSLRLPCASAQNAAREPPAAVPIRINAAIQHQTIDGFGAACAFWRPENEPLYASEAFQSLLVDDLGMTILRFEVNPRLQWEADLDAGTLDLARFDFSALKLAGGLASALTTRTGGALKVIASVWSPPPWMKTNNSTRNGGSLRPDRYAHFAKYCAGLCLGFEKTYGVPIYAMSLQNELVFQEPYDSCVYTPETIRDVTRVTGEAFRKWGVTTKIMGNEDVGCGMFQRYLQYLKPTMEAAGDYLDFLCIHGYAGDGKTPMTNRANWMELRRRLRPYQRALWMTETSGDAHDAWNGAMNVALHLHEALAYGDCAAWLYWQLNGHPGMAKDSLCVDGKPTLKYYAAKHFFRYVRPGAIRVEAGPDTPEWNVSAYLHKEDKSLTIVIINAGKAERSARLETRTPWPIPRFEAYRSSFRELCVKQDDIPTTAGTLSVTLPGRSILTLTGRAQ